MSPLIVALDFNDVDEALNLARRLDPAQCRVKVGKELFTLAGPKIVDALHALGFQLFLDLKFHDIPSTVAKACAAAAGLGVWMVNVHASGGERMMTAASEALADRPSKPKLIAVTVLTSMEEPELRAIGVERDLSNQVKSLALLAQQSGLDGVVCSAREASMLRQTLAPHSLLVTPGIRPTNLEQNSPTEQKKQQRIGADDQRRIVTPEQALTDGASYLVIGRPVIKAVDPLAALERINESILSSLPNPDLKDQ